jgi:hypothetical protein
MDTSPLGSSKYKKTQLWLLRCATRFRQLRPWLQRECLVAFAAVRSGLLQIGGFDYWGALLTLIAIGLCVAYSLPDKHPYWASIFFVIAFLQLLAGIYSSPWQAHTKGRVIVVLAIIFLSGGYVWLKSMNTEQIPQADSLWPYYWEARHPTLNTHYAASIQTKELTDYVKGGFEANLTSISPRANVWTEADMRVALDEPVSKDDQQLLSEDDPQLVSWFQNQMFPGCNCWRKYRDRTVDHVGVTSWVLLAFARMKHKPSEAQIEFILNNQHTVTSGWSDGWWPTYPSNNSEENASTYATALSIWALDACLKAGLVPQSIKERVSNAVRMGRHWLLTHSTQDRPGSWSDYQRGQYAQMSPGLSALVIHVLHSVGPDVPIAIDQDWMAHLPLVLPSAKEHVSTDYPVMLTEGEFVTDDTNNFTLPWLLIATVDAYPRGSITQRAEAVRLIRQVSDASKDSALMREVQGVPWLAAETLMGLRYVRGEIWK